MQTPTGHLRHFPQVESTQLERDPITGGRILILGSRVQAFELPPLTGPFQMLVHHSFDLHRDDAFRCWWPVSEG
jgi:hypothetical protein